MTESSIPDQRIYDAATRMIAAVKAKDVHVSRAIAETPDPQIGTAREWQAQLIIALAGLIADHTRTRLPAGISAAQLEQVLLIPANGWQARVELAESGKEITPQEADELTPALATARKVAALTIATCLPVSPEPLAGFVMVKSVMELVDNDAAGVVATTSMLARIAADVVPVL